jgi:hypothetical protein
LASLVGPAFCGRRANKLNEKGNTRKARLVGKISKKQELYIQNYLDRFKEIIERKDENTRERGIKALKKILHSALTAKSNRFEHVDSRIKDQEDSLDRWIDYLTSQKVSKYPDWIKYFVFREIIKIGNFREYDMAFNSRTQLTHAPFIEQRDDACEVVIEDLLKIFEIQNSRQPLPDYTDFKFTQREDFEDGDKITYLNFLKNKNFAKLYAMALEKYRTIGEELLKETRGEWRRYEQGSDPQKMVDSISDYGTGWCINLKGRATEYLHGVPEYLFPKNDIFIYYSFNEKQQPVVPRVAMVVDGAYEITQIRGVAPGENLDPYISEVVQRKIAQLKLKFDQKLNGPEIFQDLHRLNIIYNNFKNGIPLTRDDLIFLYQIRRQINCFGVHDQPDVRIKKILDERNLIEDVVIIFECAKEEIAFKPEDINENTVVYIGKLEFRILRKFTKKTKYIMESLPPETNIFVRDTENQNYNGEEVKFIEGTL